jgi:Tol biopolymer transport system component
LGGTKTSWGRSWSRYYAFSSTRDLTNTGSTGRQIFVYNHFNWVCQRGRPSDSGAGPQCVVPDAYGVTPEQQPFLIQVTNGPGSPDNPSVTEVFLTNNPPPAQPLAQWVAFEADGSYNGGTGCEASRRQIFLYEVYSHELRQITFACDGDSTNPTLAFHGGLLAFESTGTIMGPTSPPGIKQIYSYVRSDNVTRKVTFGAADSSFPMVNKVGTRITFQSSANLLGDQMDTGIQQIFWSDYDRQRHIHTVHQLTNGNADSMHAYNFEDRPMVAFESSATNLPGAFAPAGTQIYLARTDTEPVPDFPPVTQLTFQNELGNCTWPTVDPSNQRIAFICTQDPSPTGSPGNRVFARDLDEGGQLFG